jgi:hypothetical protein
VTIKEDIKQQIIQMSKEGKGRNQIFNELSLLNVTVSSGSISNILNEYKNNRNHITDLSNTLDTQGEGLALSSEHDNDFVNTPYSESYPSEENIIHDLETKKDLLQKHIEENKIILEANKKAADDFHAVKEEMAKCGIESDSVQFVKVVQIFRKHGYDPSKIMNASLEVQDVIAQKRNLEQLKDETNHKLKVLQRKLEEIGLGDFERLKKIVVNLMTLETYGIGVEQITSYYQNQRILNKNRGRVS